MQLDSWHTRSNDSILVFAISKGAPIGDVFRVLLEAGMGPDGTLKGATPLEVAVNLPWFQYASMVTSCLLSFGADPSVNCSHGGSLLDSVFTERRGWLLKRDQTSQLQHKSDVFARTVNQDGIIYELEDTSVARPLSLVEQKLWIEPRF